jgi:hypothetical protein
MVVPKDRAGETVRLMVGGRLASISVASQRSLAAAESTAPERASPPQQEQFVVLRILQMWKPKGKNRRTVPQMKERMKGCGLDVVHPFLAFASLGGGATEKHLAT